MEAHLSTNEVQVIDTIFDKKFEMGAFCFTVSQSSYKFLSTCWYGVELKM